MTNHLIRGLICTSLMGLNAHAQIMEGFRAKEAVDMAALCTTHTFIDLYGSEKKIVPRKYKHIYSSEPTPLDNKFEIFRKRDLGVIEIRGSTSDKMSWMVNFYSALIPAKGMLSIAGREFPYRFADDTAAMVHAGYVVAIATMADEVVAELNKLNDQGVEQVVITGHSQGGALAHLLRAYLERLPSDRLPSTIRFTTYSFAGPMVGNKAFAEDYERSFCTSNSSFSVINSEDMVPSMPVSYDDEMTMQRALEVLRDDPKSGSGAIKDALLNFLGGGIDVVAGVSNATVRTQIEGALGKLDMPAATKDWNFQHMQTRMDLGAFDYPLVLKDPSILKDKVRMRNEKKDADGTFSNKRLYKKMPNTFQHKPYNYYVGMLKEYYPRKYKRLKIKVLPENL